MAAGVRYRILYWEAADFQGIKFAEEDISKKGKRSVPCPGICRGCEGIVDSYRFRLDNMQSSLRMCIGPDGARFRDEIVDFVCLSPWMCIQYHLRQFQRYNAIRSVHHLTEESVIGTAIRVHRGEIDSQLSGVAISTFTETGPGEWLQRYALDVRQAAEAARGISVGLMLDKRGVEVGSFGQTVASFAHAPNPPIREVVVLLGGPKGIEPQVLPKLLKALEGNVGRGLHLESVIRMKLPGGRQHSYVALGDLLSSHDSGYLVPIMEDYRLLGRERYRAWHEAMSAALLRLSDARGGPEEKWALLADFRESIQAEQRSRKRRRADGHSEAETAASEEGLDSAGEAEGLPEPAHAGATPRDVDLLLGGLEQRGLLARPRPWRAKQCLEAVEPCRAIDALLLLERGARRALAAGAPLDDPWGALAESIDAELARQPAGEKATPLAVREALAQDLAAVAHLPGTCCKAAAALRILPCEAACGLVRIVAKRGRKIENTDWIYEAELHLTRSESSSDVAMALIKEAKKCSSRRLLERKRSSSEPRRDPSRRLLSRTTSLVSLPKSLWADPAAAAAAAQAEEREAGEQRTPTQPSHPPPAARGEEGFPGAAPRGLTDIEKAALALGLLDERALTALRELPEDVAKTVLLECQSPRVRNPSAWAVRKVRDYECMRLEQDALQRSQAGPDGRVPKQPSGPPPIWLQHGGAPQRYGPGDGPDAAVPPPVLPGHDAEHGGLSAEVRADRQLDVQQEWHARQASLHADAAASERRTPIAASPADGFAARPEPGGLHAEVGLACDGAAWGLTDLDVFASSDWTPPKQPPVAADMRPGPASNMPAVSDFMQHLADQARSMAPSPAAGPALAQPQLGQPAPLGHADVQPQLGQPAPLGQAAALPQHTPQGAPAPQLIAGWEGAPAPQGSASRDGAGFAPMQTRLEQQGDLAPQLTGGWEAGMAPVQTQPGQQATPMQPHLGQQGDLASQLSGGWEAMQLPGGWEAATASLPTQLGQQPTPAQPHLGQQADLASQQPGGWEAGVAPVQTQPGQQGALPPQRSSGWEAGMATVEPELGRQAAPPMQLSASWEPMHPPGGARPAAGGQPGLADAGIALASAAWEPMRAPPAGFPGGAGSQQQPLAPPVAGWSPQYGVTTMANAQPLPVQLGQPPFGSPAFEYVNDAHPMPDLHLQAPQAGAGQWDPPVAPQQSWTGLGQGQADQSSWTGVQAGGQGQDFGIQQTWQELAQSFQEISGSPC